MRFVIPRIVLPAVALGFSSHAMAQRADASALHEERADNAQPHDDHASIDCEILVPPGGYRGLSNDYFWPNGIVPYVLDVSSTRAKLARAAMDEIEWVSNVRFVERTTEPNYIRVRNSTGNSAHVGMIGGEQFVNIRSWNTHGTIIHELLHSLSFWHEHQRPDRDTFVEVLWGNIQAGRENNFVTHSFASTFGDYDFQSLMHYGSYAFASCDCFTIRMRPGFESFQGTIGQRAGVSQGDIEMLMHFYGGGPVHIPRTNTSFLTLQGALAQSIPQDRIEASPIGIQAAGSFTIPSQQTLLATASIEQLAALTWTLEQASTLQTRGADISLGGVLEVATGAWGTIRSDYLTADFQSTLKVNPSSTLSIVGREAAIQGEIQLLDDSALLLLSESATLGNNSRVTAGRDSTLIAYGANGLDIASETEMLHGSHLASVNSLSLSQEAHLRINADSSASISSDDMELSGPMRLHARSTLVLDANHLEFQPLSITLEPDASLVLATPTLNAPDSVSIPHKERLLHSAQPGSRVVTAHDMNADGLDDTIINSFTSQGVEIYLNQGEPFYQYQLSQTVDGTMRLATGIDVADIDNDTNPDIILFSTGENKIIVYRNTDPTTLAFEEHVVDAGALGVSAVRVTDYDNDSDLDLIASLKNASEIILYELVDPQTWVFAKHTLSSSIIQPSDIQASDIDNDNDIDCVIASPLVSTLYVLRSGSPGDLSPSLEIVTASSQFAQAIAVKDLDDDGLPEIVAGNIYLDIYWPDNTASTYTKETIASGIIGVKKILVSNVNTDNTEDIVALVPNQTYIKWFENHTHVGEGWKSKQQSFPSSKAFDVDIIDSNDDAVREILSINVSGSSLIYSVESDSTRQVRAMNGSRISSGATLPLTLPVTLDDATVEAPEIHFKASARLSGLLLGDVLTSNFLRLTGPTTIDGDLTILPGGVVDLNGHTLTVTGTTTPPITTRSKSATNSPCPTDLNLDNTIDGADLGLVLSSWGQPGISDLNSDGTTDGSDLGLLLSSWGRCAGAR